MLHSRPFAPWPALAAVAVGGEPAIHFIHFRADGAPATVAAGLRGALDAAR